MKELLPELSPRSSFTGDCLENTRLWQEKVRGFVTGLSEKRLLSEVSNRAIASLQRLPEKLGDGLVCPTSISIDDEGLVLEFNFGVGERIFIEIEADGEMTSHVLENGKVVRVSELPA